MIGDHHAKVGKDACGDQSLGRMILFRRRPVGYPRQKGSQSVGLWRCGRMTACFDRQRSSQSVGVGVVAGCGDAHAAKKKFEVYSLLG